MLEKQSPLEIFKMKIGFWLIKFEILDLCTSSPIRQPHSTITSSYWTVRIHCKMPQFQTFSLTDSEICMDVVWYPETASKQSIMERGDGSRWFMVVHVLIIITVLMITADDGTWKFTWLFFCSFGMFELLH